MKINLDYETIKAIMGIENDFTDDTVLPLIDAVASYAYEAGVSQETLESAKAYGLLACGAKDLYDFGNSGSANFSPMFNLMLVQLASSR